MNRLITMRYMRRIVGIYALFILLTFSGCMNVKDEQTGSVQETTEDVNAAIETTSVQHSLDDVTSVGDGKFVCYYEGVKHDFIVDLPSVNEQAPLIVMLHGYGESAEAFRAKTSFEKDANAMGYAVVYVTGAPSPEDATSSNGWNSGVGESGNDDVGFLSALVENLCDQYGFDSQHVYAVGFSNGAFMTHRLAVESGEVFAAVASVAGMMPEYVWDKRPASCSTSVLQITGEKDDVVPKNSDGSAKYAQAPAIENVMDYYVEKSGLTGTDTATIGKQSVLTKYTSSDSEKQVWNLFIPDGRHAWPDQQITGVDVNHLILEFFEEFCKK